MLIKDDSAFRTKHAALTVAVCLIGVGLVAWYFARPRTDTATSSLGDPPASGPFQSGLGVAAAGDLPTLYIDIAPEHVATLREARAAALAAGALTTRAEQKVPARVRFGSTEAVARLRLKGDLLDHVDTDKWSFRIDLKGGASHLGMSSYSIQHPKTRGFLLEWLITAAARRDDLLAPRSTFVNVTVNDRSNGVYYLEEHFSKEMLESQGRRDGAIVRLREDTLWSTWQQYGYLDGGQPVPPIVQLGTSPMVAELGAFDEQRLARVDSLNARLQRALEQLRRYQSAALNTAPHISPLAVEACEESRRTVLDTLFVADKFGGVAALSVVFGALHGSTWNQKRFYHDPVLDRLEPIVFDTGANPIGGPPIDMLLPALISDGLPQACYEAGYRALARYSSEEYVAGMFADLGDDYRRFGRALVAEGIVPSMQLVEEILALIEGRCTAIRGLINPLDCANYSTRRMWGKGPDGEHAGYLEVEAWATTAIPVEVDRFTFSNGGSVAAADAVDSQGQRFRRPGGRVALPPYGERLTFLFAVDRRLAGLRNVSAIKRAVRQATEKDQSVKLEVDVHFAPVTSTEQRTERLRIRRVEGGASDPTGRPEPPSLVELLDRHPCLVYDFGDGLLHVRRGTWNVVGDLILPAGLTLVAEPGTVLRFAPGAVLLSESPVLLLGSADEPVVLEPLDATQGWGGLIVIETEIESRLEHAVVRGASAVERGGWQVTGGVTFYRAAVAITDSHLVGHTAEDVLNVFGCPFRLQRVLFEGGASDLLDSDFATGTVRDCEFKDSVEDAIDISGGSVEISHCRFDSIGDKAFSFGEDSRGQIRDCHVTMASIAVAAKDNARVEIDRLSIDRVGHYAIAVFVKKTEYGPSEVIARDLTLGSPRQSPHLVQTKCRLEVDGVLWPTTDVDVEALYKQRILGK